MNATDEIGVTFSQGADPALVEYCKGLTEFADVVLTVTQHNEFHPYRAKRIDATGALVPALDDMPSDASTNRQALSAAYFFDNRVCCYNKAAFPSGAVNIGAGHSVLCVTEVQDAR